MDDQSVKVDNHCQAPLPLRNLVMKLPNNQKIERESRAHYLKKRFEKDPKYFHHYKEFMEEILSKGYDKISKDTSTDGKVCICLTMECTIQPNPIRFVLFLIAVQSM